MLKTISKKIHHISTGWVTALSILIMALFMIFVLPAQAEKSIVDTSSSRSPDTSFFYSPEELYQMADDYGQEGRQAYIRSRWTFDLIFPLVYVFFLSVGISWFYRFSTHWKQYWIFGNLLPILGGIFDYLENIAATLIMYYYPTRLPGIAQVSVFFSATKWGLIFLGFLVYFILGLGYFYALIKQE